VSRVFVGFKEKYKKRSFDMWETKSMFFGDNIISLGYIVYLIKHKCWFSTEIVFISCRGRVILVCV